VQVGVNCAFLTKVKVTNDRYPRCASEFKVISLKATSHSQGGIALLWNKGHASFEVEAVKIVTPNLLTFQLVTGYKQFYMLGIYIPPNKLRRWMRFARHGHHAGPTAFHYSLGISILILSTPETNGRNK
jgi:hypothetical protein